MFATMPVATAITTTTNCLLTKAITLASDNGVAAVIFQSSAPLVLGQQHRTPSPCHPFAKPRLIHYIASPKKVALTTVWLDMTLAAPPSVCVVDVTIVVNGAAKFVAAIVVVGNILAVSWLCTSLVTYILALLPHLPVLAVTHTNAEHTLLLALVSFSLWQRREF